MNPKNYQTISLFTVISIAVLLFILWLVDYSGSGIPELIPGIGYRTYGIFILAAFLIILILLQKRLLKNSPDTTAAQLIAASAFVSFVSLFMYQVIRNFFVLKLSFINKLPAILLSSFFPALIFTLLSAIYAFSFKKAESIRSSISILLLIIILVLIRRYVQTFDW